MNSMSRRFLTLLAVVTLVLLGAARPSASAATPMLKIEPAMANPGATVKLTISGFSADASVWVRFDGRTWTTATTNGRGRAIVRAEMPSSVAGSHELTATSGRVSATASIEATPIVRVETRRIDAGSTIVARIAGFSAGERVSFFLLRGDVSLRLPSTLTGERGDRAKTLAIPADLRTGTYTLEARGRTGLLAYVRLAIRAAQSGATETVAPTMPPATETAVAATPTSTQPPTSTQTPTATPIPATSTATSTVTTTATKPPSTPRPTNTATPGGAISIWVDPANGSDSSSGDSRAHAVRTLAEAWNRVPSGSDLAAPYRIRLVAGSYPSSGMPNYMEQRYGTGANPITIEAADGAGTAIVNGSMNIYDVRYLTIRNLTLRNAGDVLHCELCRHFTITGSTLDGQGSAHETLKINQSQYVDLLDSDFGGSYENAIDFVAVQHGRITGNRIHDAADWCMYLKGGSADFWIEANEIYACGTGGFTAGQGTGFQFMVRPWITYEAQDITFIRNEIHDTDGAGFGVSGGKNILFAENHLVRVGARSHLIEIGFGGRSCDGHPGDDGRERCAEYLAAGGWGTIVVDDGDNYVRIPNKNVTIRDNTVNNPDGYQSQWQHFFIAGPYDGASQSGTNAPNPAYADDEVVITGNVIRNGDASMPLGIGEDSGCQATNPTCNEAQLYADNDINGR